MNDKPIFDYNDEEKKFDRENNVLAAAVVLCGLVLVAILVFAESCSAQAIGETQIGVQEIRLDFTDPGRTDTLVVVGEQVRFVLPVLPYIDFENPSFATIELRWPGVEWIIANDFPVIERAVVFKVNPGYSQFVKVNVWSERFTVMKPSREYFLIVLHDMPNLDLTGNGELTVGDKIYLGNMLGLHWPQRGYNATCDLNNDGRIDDIDVKIFEQAMAWQ